MPGKIRDLIRELEKAGFELEPGKGSHRKFRHPLTTEIVVVSGRAGDDCRPYQEKDVQTARAKLMKSRKGKKP